MGREPRPTVQLRIAPESSVLTPGNARRPRTRFVRGTDRAPDPDRDRCHTPLVFRKAAAAQHLAIDQYAVTVENDEIGLNHRAFPISIRAYTPEMGNNSCKGGRSDCLSLRTR